VFLVFIGLESAALSIARVKQRVRQGGHDVPVDRLRARFPCTLANLREAIGIVDEAFLFDNSSFEAPYRIIAVYREGAPGQPASADAAVDARVVGPEVISVHERRLHALRATEIRDETCDHEELHRNEHGRDGVEQHHLPEREDQRDRQ